MSSQSNRRDSYCLDCDLCNVYFCSLNCDRSLVLYDTTKPGFLKPSESLIHGAELGNPCKSFVWEKNP